MATVRYDGFDKLTQEVQRDIKALGQRMTDAVIAGSEVMIEALRKEAAESFKNPTGELSESIDVAPPGVQRDTTLTYAEVYPQGYHSTTGYKAYRNAAIGYILNYGVEGRIDPNDWDDRADRAARKDIRTAMEKELFGK